MTITKEEIEAVLAGKIDAPHVQSAFVNAVTEEGTRAELAGYLQTQFNAICALRKLARALALEALSSREAGWQVKIKALVWKRANNRKDWSAETVIGRYDVGVVGFGYSAILRHVVDVDTHDVSVASRMETATEAKAAAQADYDARIRSALLPTPPHQGSK